MGGETILVDNSLPVTKIEVTDVDGVVSVLYPTTVPPGETPTIEVPLDTPIILKAKV